MGKVRRGGDGPFNFNAPRFYSKFPSEDVEIQNALREPSKWVIPLRVPWLVQVPSRPEKADWSRRRWKIRMKSAGPMCIVFHRSIRIGKVFSIMIASEDYASDTLFLTVSLLYVANIIGIAKAKKKTQLIIPICSINSSVLILAKS